jgi:hypothetical protein
LLGRCFQVLQLAPAALIGLIVGTPGLDPEGRRLQYLGQPGASEPSVLANPPQRDQIAWSGPGNEHGASVRQRADTIATGSEPKDAHRRAHRKPSSRA